MNRITVHGRLGMDPELRVANGYKGDFTVCNISIACNRRFGDETDWFRCSCFGKLAEVIDKFFKKGDEIIVHGEMQSNKAQDGKIFWHLNIENFEFCGSGKSDSNSRAEPDSSVPSQFEEMDEDIPF